MAVSGQCGSAAGLGDVVGRGQAVQVDRSVAHGRKDLGAVAGVGMVTVLVECDVAHPVHAVLDSPVLAQPGRDRGGSGVLEGQAADGVDDLDGSPDTSVGG